MVNKQERSGTGVGGKLVNNRFMPEYQKLMEDMNLVQMKHTRSFKACVHDFNAQMNATPKMDEFSKKCIFLVGLRKWVVDALFKFLKLLEDVAGIIKVVEKTEEDVSKRRPSAPSKQSGLNKNAPLGKGIKKFASRLRVFQQSRPPKRKTIQCLRQRK